MEPPPVASTPAPADRLASDAIERLLDEIAQMASPDLAPRDYFAHLLQRSVQAVAAGAALVWGRGDAGEIRLEHQFQLKASGVLANAGSEQAHARLLNSVWRTHQARLVPPDAANVAPDARQNPTDWLLVLCPIRVDGATQAVLELCQRPTTNASLLRGYSQIGEALSELAGDYLRQRQLRELRERVTFEEELARFAGRVGTGLDLKQTAYRIANEGRDVAHCDRLSVLECRGGSARTLAISGVDRHDRRAQEVVRLERLVAAVAATGEALWHTDDSPTLAPQIYRPLQAYLDDAHSRTIVVLPVFQHDEKLASEVDRRRAVKRNRPVAALVFERFSAAVAGGVEETQVLETARRAAPALRNCLWLRRQPGAHVARLLGWMFGWTRLHHLPKSALMFLGVAGAVAALCLVPAELTLEGRGELQPKIRRDVFAPADAIVDELRVTQGSQVDPAQPDKKTLLTLKRPELEQERARLQGEAQTARSRQATLKASRLATPRITPADQVKHQQLTAEEEEVKQLLSSLEEQLRLLEQEFESLIVQTPIAGEVLTWDLKETLADRPVRRGQLLMNVAQTAGPWVVEIDMPDHRVGHILAARSAAAQPLAATMVLAAQPGETLSATVLDVAKTTTFDQDGKPVVRVTLEFDSATIADKRPGATVVAQVQCGRRALGYVWFHEFWEAFQRWLMW